MSNYLEEVELKKAKKEYLESYYIGKKSLVLCLKEFSTVSNDCSNKYSIVLKELKITSIDDNLNIIGVDNSLNEFCINENLASKIIILNLEDLKVLLLSLFMKKQYVEMVKYPVTTNLLSNLKDVDNVNLDKLFISQEVGFNNTNKYLYHYVPYSKVNIEKKKPLILCFDKKINEICLKKTSASHNGILINSKDIVSVDNFKNGFYYGLDELDNIVNDIINYYNEYFNEKSMFRKFLEKVFSF